jgi:hypothetical protein
MTQIIRNEGDTTTDITELQKIVRDYCKLYINKLDILKEVDIFVDK